MKYYFFILLALFICNYSFSQQASYFEVEYLKEVIFRVDTTNRTQVLTNSSRFNEILSESGKGLKYKLRIDTHSSEFLYMKELTSDSENDMMKNLAINIGGTEGLFYINKRDSTGINKINYFDTNFRIKLENKKWKILNDTKVIGRYTCYKAVTIDTVKNSKGVFTHNVIAWFAPKLPSYFGPAGYFGLPGLILELDNSKVIISASKIMRLDKKFEIKKPKSGKLVTEDEFTDITIKAGKNFKSLLFKKSQ